jgi:hypothetical protein
VTIYLPDGVDKAIDIKLKFHGIDQDSPRLTLSEGYRNSLGLCIFLAMAKHDSKYDRPLLLDDVIVSLDRNHRGLLIDVLLQTFGDRQLLILTHDREWYTELRHRLPSSNWSYFALLPYLTPEIGIRLSQKMSSFDDARAQLQERPDSAGNDARKIMDLELSMIAERVGLKLPYLRGEKNDMRMAHAFLERILADGKKCFQLEQGDLHKPHEEALQRLEEAQRLLSAWGNRASHSFDVVCAEAAKLIDACEAGLAVFACVECGKSIWFADASGAEWIQCACGAIRWRYGKG